MSKPSNKICPRCGKPGYVYYIGQSNIYEAKCYNCDYYFAFGELDLYEEKTPQTNADRIRAKSVEEMAEFINGVEAEAIRRAGLFITVGDIQRGKEGWLDWLKQEVSTDG